MSLNQTAYTDNLAVIAPFSPASLWQWFAHICATPHPSYHEDALATDIVAWAGELGLTAYRDDAGNVIIKKDGTAHLKTAPAIALQAHLDMVPQANSDTAHDFSTDAIRLRLNPDDPDWLMATGTTLGADNGIGMASILAVLGSTDIAHPPLEAILTMTEETGMVGVKALKPNTLSAARMINTDTEEIGEVYMGCAGGIDADVSLPLCLTQAGEFHAAIAITVKGLKGGHSGIDIHKNRASAIKLIARILAALADKTDAFRLIDITGGTLRNAIAREACTHIACRADDIDAIRALIAAEADVIMAEISMAEPKFSCQITHGSHTGQVVDGSSTQQMIDLIQALPNGVVRLSDAAPDTVETSLSLGQVSITDGQLHATLLVRSLTESAKAAVCSTISSVARLAGADAYFSGDYTGWTPVPTSVMTRLAVDSYTAVTGQVPALKVIHAGLECGLIKQSHPQMDIVSIGPTIKNAHSPDEQVHIGSVAVYWDVLVKMLGSAA